MTEAPLPRSDPPSEGAPRVLRERYRLDAQIGEGGMGVVYRGVDLALERAVAVKLTRAQPGDDVFEDRGLPAAVHDHLETAPMKLRQRAPDAGIPAALDAAVLRCLAKRPEDRFASASAAAAALRDANVNANVNEASAPLEMLVKGDDIAPDASSIAERASERETDPALQFELADVAAAQTPTPRLGPRTCAQCGTENQRYAQFCSVCSDLLDSAEQVELRARAPLALAPELIPLVPFGREREPLAGRLLTNLALLPAGAKGRLAAHSVAALVILNAWAFGFGFVSTSLLVLVLVIWISIFLGPIRRRRK